MRECATHERRMFDLPHLHRLLRPCLYSSQQFEQFAALLQNEQLGKTQYRAEAAGGQAFRK